MTFVLPSQVSEDTTSAPCDLCKKPADTHCLDCKQYLCSQCRKQHDAFKPMKGHKVVAASDVLSGKVSSKGRHCEIHGELIRFYCNSEDKQVCQDCITLKTCAIEHDRVTLAEAAKKQLESLHQLASDCASKKEIYCESLSKIEQMRVSLNESHHKAHEELENLIMETTEKLQELLQEKRSTLADKYSTKDTKLNDTETELKSKLSSTEKACTLAADILSNGSDHDVTYKYSTLKTTMQGIIASQDQEEVNESLGELGFEPGKPEDYLNLGSELSATAQSIPPTPDSPPPLEQLPSGIPSGPWTSFLEFRPTYFTSPRDIAVFPYGELAIASDQDGANIYCSIIRGEYRCTLKSTPKKLNAIAVTPDGRIITDGRSKLLCYNKEGKQLGTIPTMSPPVAVAVDNTGRIIAGLYENTISVHHADGSLINYFETSVMPYYISATSRETLVVTFADAFNEPTLEVITYEGRSVTIIEPPSEQIQWSPGYTCCSPKDEIFVINETRHNFIFWYKYDGQYLGLITPFVQSPRGLTFLEMCDELIVAQKNGVVKSFLRQSGS